MAVRTKHGVNLHSGYFSAFVWCGEVNIKQYRYFRVESAGVNVTASVTFPFHSPLNEPKEVSLQNTKTLLEDNHTTPVVIDWTCPFLINLENGGRIEKC